MDYCQLLSHPGIFRGRALWADKVSPRMNSIASRDQFKPIRTGENLVVNYEGLIVSLSKSTLSRHVINLNQ